MRFRIAKCYILIEQIKLSREYLFKHYMEEDMELLNPCKMCNFYEFSSVKRIIIIFRETA